MKIHEIKQAQEIDPVSKEKLSSQLPPEFPPNVIYKLLNVMAEVALLVAETQQRSNQSSQQKLQESKTNNQKLLTNNYWQAGCHLVTAFGAVAAGVGAAQMGVDVASTMSTATKCGEAGSSVLRGKEQYIQGEQKIVDNGLTKGSEASRKANEFMEQYRRTTEALIRLRGEMT